MNMLVSHAFKVSAARAEALRARSTAWTRPRFWVLLSANIFLVCVFCLASVHIGVCLKQQAYESARLAGSYSELSRQIADLQAQVQSMTTVNQIRSVAVENEIGLAPRRQAGILLGPEPLDGSMVAVQEEKPGSTTISSCIVGQARNLFDGALRALGELSIFERTGGSG